MILFLALMQVQAVQPAPVIEIPRIAEDVVVDGVLDEPVWSRAAVLTGFRQYEPVDGRPAAERTEVLVWYAPDAIHFGVRAYDSQPAAIRATRADRDNVSSEDHVIIYLDTFNDSRRAFFFGANALGVQMDGVRTEGAASAGRTFGGNLDDSPDYVFETAGRLTDDGYVIEFRIPFKSLRFPGADEQSWGLQVERTVQRTGYRDTWTDVRRANASFLIQSGTITGLRDLERGVVVEVQPFMTATALGIRDPVTGAFERQDPDPEFGVNLRFGFSNVSLDATVNPDFSQVESDAAQSTVNERFALFFPEKRPFFLEGIELFATPNQLVYTRRIVDPIAGGKVSGKVGRIGVAHLTAVDEGIGGAPDALFNVTRLRTDFGANSLAGLVFTDRTELDGDVYNRVAAADVRYVFGGMYYLEVQAGGAWSRRFDGTGDFGPIWHAEVDRTGRSFGFNYNVTGISGDFRSDAGFVNRTGIINARAFNRFTWYGAAGATVETAQVIVNPGRIWAYDDREPLEGGESMGVDVRLRGGWQLDGSAGRAFVNLFESDYTHLVSLSDDVVEPYQPLPDVSGFEFEIGVRTPTWQRAEARLGFETGQVAIFPEGSDGYGRELSLDLTLRPTNSLRVLFTGAWEQIWRERDDTEFARAIIPRLLAEFQPTRAFFLRAIGEYRAERRAALLDARTGEPLRSVIDQTPIGADALNGLRVDLLAAYEPRPGVVAYVGYGASLHDAEAFRFRGVERLSDGLFLKLAYQFRR